MQYKGRLLIMLIMLMKALFNSVVRLEITSPPNISVTNYLLIPVSITKLKIYFYKMSSET